MCCSAIRVNIRPSSTRSMPPPPAATGQQDGQRVALGRHPLGLTQRLTHQPPPPERQPTGDAGVSLDRRPHLADDEAGVPGVPEDLDHQLARLVVKQHRDLSVEVGSDPVTDVGLDQTLEPVCRCG